MNDKQKILIISLIHFNKNLPPDYKVIARFHSLLPQKKSLVVSKI